MSIWGWATRDPAGEFAISIAEKFGAHVLGLAFAYEPVIPGAVMGGIPPEFIETQRAEAEQQGQGGDRPLRGGWPGAPASPTSTASSSASLSGAADQLGRIARRFDLVVVGQPEREETMPEEVIDEGALFESGRPVIFVPFIHKGGIKLDRVMMCWDGSRAATRAIADSLPLMKQAKQVEVVIIATGPSQERRAARRRSRPASRPPRAQSRRQAHHLARYRYRLHHPLLRRRFLGRPDRHGRLRPFAPARIRARRRDARHARVR